MNMAVVGVGSGGCRLANELVAVEQSTGRHLSRGKAIAIDTKETDYRSKVRIPEDRRLFIGDVHRGVDGQGTDGDPDLGAEVAREDRHEVIRAFDALELHDVDAVLVVAGLGRGTGGGAGAVVLEELQGVCDEPVYALAVLPGEDEGHQRAHSAARSLQSFVDHGDNVIGFDNGAWREDEGTPEQDYREANGELAKRIVTLFGAGEFGRDAAPENRLDPSDMMRTLATGGVSTIGYAETRVPGSRRGLRAWLRRLSWSTLLPYASDGQEDGPPETDAVKINQLVRRAAHSKLTLPCDISSAERALIMLSGPSAELSRKGFESGRFWLEEEADTVEVMAGDEPHEGTKWLTATVLFSNVTDVPRIQEMKEQAVRA
jgi:cell division GTPase FtsZ